MRVRGLRAGRRRAKKSGAFSPVFSADFLSRSGRCGAIRLAPGRWRRGGVVRPVRRCQRKKNKTKSGARHLIFALNAVIARSFAVNFPCKNVVRGLADQVFAGRSPIGTVSTSGVSLNNQDFRLFFFCDLRFCAVPHRSRSFMWAVLICSTILSPWMASADMPHVSWPSVVFHLSKRERFTQTATLSSTLINKAMTGL